MRFGTICQYDVVTPIADCLLVGWEVVWWGVGWRAVGLSATAVPSCGNCCPVPNLIWESVESNIQYNLTWCYRLQLLLLVICLFI